MNFRATSFAIGSRAIRFSALHNADLLKFQEQISSGQRLQRPSDNPITYRQVTALTSRLTELRTDTQSLNGAKSVLNMSVVQVEEFSQLMTSARSLALQGVQVVDDNERNALKLEVDGILNQMQNIANSKFDGSFIYGGTLTGSAPFTFSEPTDAGGTLSVEYHGSYRNSRAAVGESVTVETYYSGNSVFANSNRGETIVIGETGAQPGLGTDTMIGRASLTVAHLRTDFTGASGVLNGRDAVAHNTIIGNHQLTIVDLAGDGSSGTVSLDGSTPVPFTSADTNLEVKNNFGEVVFLDTSAITPGFNGTFDIDATGQISIDGGKSFTEIVSDESLVVTDSVSGKFATIDTRNIERVGVDSIEFEGTSDAFQILFELSQDLENGRNLSNSDLADALNRKVGELEKMTDHALGVLGEQSTSLKTLELLEYRIQDLELSVETQLSDIQSTNIPETVLRMENSQQLLEYTYAVTARLNSIDLINFLR